MPPPRPPPLPRPPLHEYVDDDSLQSRDEHHRDLTWSDCGLPDLFEAEFDGLGGRDRPSAAVGDDSGGGGGDVWEEVVTGDSGREDEADVASRSVPELSGTRLLETYWSDLEVGSGIIRLNGSEFAMAGWDAKRQRST